MSARVVFITYLLVVCLLSPSAMAAEPVTPNKRVLVISIDGLGFNAFQTLKEHAPTLSKLAKHGALASSETIFPSMTWPSHASLLTGCKPMKHRILGNRVFDRKARKVIHASTVPYAKTFGVETIFDIAHKKGLKTAAILWPSTQQAKNINFNIPEVYGQKKFARWSTKGLLKRLKRNGLPTHKLGKFSENQMFLQDTFARDAAIELIGLEAPELMMVHFLSVDSLGHSYGPTSRPYRWGIELVDRYVGDMLKALEKRNLLVRTNVMVVSDHGFLTIKHRFDADKLLHQKGLIKSLKRLDKGPVRTVSNGHALFVYILKDAPKNTRTKIRQLFASQDQVENVFGPKDYRQLGLPTRSKESSSPDLIVLSKPNIIFGRIKGGDALLKSSAIPGMHGYLPNHPNMRPLFIAHGPDIKEFKGPIEARKGQQRPWQIQNIDIAPTLATMLGLKFSAPVDGKVLNEMFVN